MNGKQLKNSILQWAIQGKLVPQDPNDEPASVLLDKIRQEKERLIKEKKIKRDKNASIIYRGEDNSYYEKLLATGEVKCIDEEVPFEIPKGWEWCRLASVSFSIADGDHMPPPKSFDGIPFIVISNIAKGVLDLNTTRYVPVEYYEKLSKERVPQKDDILFSVTGSYGIAVRILTANVFCFQRHIALIKPLLASAEYIELLLNSPLIRTQCDKTATGMAQKTVGIDSLRRFLVPIPPFQEQIKIVEKCNLLEPFIRKCSEVQEKLNRINEDINEELKKSILQEAIQGKLVPQIANEGTAQELLEQIKAEKQELVKEGKLKKSALVSSVIFRGDDNKYYEQVGKKCLDITELIPFEIPNSWTWARMGHIGDWGAGSTPQRSNQDYYGGNILWLKTGELNNDVICDTEEKITQKAFQECSLRMNKIGDVLIAMYGATIGKLAIVGKELTTNQACCGCTPYVVYNWFLFYFLMASRDTFIKKGEGGAQPNISRVKLVEHLIPLPPLNEQKRIVERIETLFEQLR